VARYGISLGATSTPGLAAGSPGPSASGGSRGAGGGGGGVSGGGGAGGRSDQRRLLDE